METKQTTRNLKKCKYCGKEYDSKEVSRIYGSLSPVLSGGYCSSACYTKVAIKEPPTPTKEGLHTPKQPYYKGNGEHSVNELESICQQYKEYVSYLNSGNERQALLDALEYALERIKDFDQKGDESIQTILNNAKNIHQ